MQEYRDYSLIFSQLESSISEDDLVKITHSVEQCQEIDPNIQEMVKYLECINQPEPETFSGI
nr:hypothetical protein [uncultured Sphaerochaeta sp.]